MSELRTIIPIETLKEALLEMLNLVKHQVELTKEAVLNFNKDAAEEVIHREKQVNSLDLFIDKESEKVIALHQPVAVDLRFVISCLNMNTFLERIGDNAQSMCKYVLNMDHSFPSDIITKNKVERLFTLLDDMFVLCLEAQETEETSKAGVIFTKDREIDKINTDAVDIITEAIKADQENISSYLNLLSIIRKCERIGDLLENIAEQHIFYLDAKVLKHKKKKIKKFIEKNSDTNTTQD